jgi:hypothetical protein
METGTLIEGQANPTEIVDTWPAAPVGLARLGYVLLAAIGGLMALGGVTYGLLTLSSDNSAADSVLAITVATIGLAMVVQSRRALDVALWRKLSLLPAWAWLGLLAVVWGLGIVLLKWLPDGAQRALPLLIVAASGLASLLFLSLTLRGLRSPVERQPLSGRLLPQHQVFLSTAVAAAFSTGLALVTELVVFVVAVAAILVVSQLLGDPSILGIMRQVARDPGSAQQLEDWVLGSPVALAALGGLLVVIAPAIEEALKGLPLLLFAHQGARLTERVAILVGVTGGVGFAFAENAGYMSMLSEDWWLGFWLRVAAAVMHGSCSAFIGRAWYRGIVKRRWGGMLLDLLTGWGVHAAWNGLALLVAWFSYQESTIGVLFCVLAGLLPLTVLFAWMAGWGIWASER